MPEDLRRPLNKKLSQLGLQSFQWDNTARLMDCHDKCWNQDTCGSFYYESSTKKCRGYPSLSDVGLFRVRTPNFPQGLQELCGYCRSAPRTLVDAVVAMSSVGEENAPILQQNYIDLTKFVGLNVGSSAFSSGAGRQAVDSAIEMTKALVTSTNPVLVFAQVSMKILDSFFAPKQPNYLAQVAEQMSIAFNEFQDNVINQFEKLQIHTNIKMSRKLVRTHFKAAENNFHNAMRNHLVSLKIQDLRNAIQQLGQVHTVLSDVEPNIRPYFYPDVMEAALLDISAHVELLLLLLKEKWPNDQIRNKQIRNNQEDCLKIGIKWLKLATSFGSDLAEARAAFVTTTSKEGSTDKCGSNWQDVVVTRRRRVVDEFRNNSEVVNSAITGLRSAISWLDITEGSYGDETYEQIYQRYITDVKDSTNSYVQKHYRNLFKLVLTLFKQMQEGHKLAFEKYGHEGSPEDDFELLYSTDLNNEDGILSISDLKVDNYIWYWETTLNQCDVCATYKSSWKCILDQCRVCPVCTTKNQPQKVLGEEVVLNGDQSAFNACFPFVVFPVFVLQLL
jgi:hypothetical protein